MPQPLTRADAIAALELSFDYYSARAVLTNFLSESKLDAGLDKFDDKQIGLLLAHLQAALPRSQRAIDLVVKKTGVDGGAPKAEPAAAAPAPAPQDDKKADAKDDKADAKDDKKADAKDDKADAKDAKADAKDDKKADAKDAKDDKKADAKDDGKDDGKDDDKKSGKKK